MIGRHTTLALATLVLGAAPVLAQGHEHAAAGQGNAHAMICTMGMLPHGSMGGGMGGGMGMGGMMKQGGMMGGMQGQAQAGQAQGQHAGHAAAGQPAQAGQAQGQHAGHAMGQAGQPAQAGKPNQDKPAATALPAPGGMNMEHPVTPTMLIHHAKDLGLSQDQVTRVTQLATSSQSDCERHMQMAMQAHDAAAKLLGGPAANPDLAGYEAKLREATTHVLQAHLGVVRAGVDAKAVLTPEQRTRLGTVEKAGHH